ncbi:signal peptidase I [Streptomyces zingiberis]|uniref:Signal peptidase I n=1 Tax=Streptomyces zingiberis TaxID=2053010 RepID=A0ABX1BX83_9ACTN|nr:signal peptidase I [Streptomyces zingiberis]NJQ02297.1 signal peptidase I [Streptomyces zingiberis]
MDTDEQLSERDRSPAPDEGRERRSRSARSGPGWRGARRAVPGAVLRLRRAAARAPWRWAGAVTAVAVAVVLMLSAWVVQPFLVPSGSMEPTLRVGDRVLVNKLAYRFGNEPRRGDVVVFDGTGSFVHGGRSGGVLTGPLREAAAAVGLVEPEETDYVKRVVGTGGDRVTCCDERGRIKVNGVALDEVYLPPGESPSQVPFDIAVPEGRLWVMGDHRGDSRDSRDHLGSPGGGTVPVERVIGRADWIGWPARHWTTVTAPADPARRPHPALTGEGGSHG